MEKWVLQCRKCKVEFTYSTIADVGAPGLSITHEPDFPLGGSELRCYNCGHQALYQRTDLAYRAALETIGERGTTA